MANLNIYKIALKNLSQGTHKFTYKVDNTFFGFIEGSEVLGGEADVDLTLTKTSSTFELEFHITGKVNIPCDRCLEAMEQEIETINRLIVKYGNEDEEESDDVIIVSDKEAEINIAWYIYEFIALEIPIKHTHEDGECDEEVYAILKKHLTFSAEEFEDENDYLEEEEEKEIDPRWEALKSLKKDK